MDGSFREAGFRYCMERGAHSDVDQIMKITASKTATMTAVQCSMTQLLIEILYAHCPVMKQ